MKSRLPSVVEYVAAGIMCLLFAGISVLSFSSIIRTQGNARVVNYVGIVRGASQKLVKEELQGYPDDQLIASLDSIVHELLTGEGTDDLIVLQDETYLAQMKQVESFWETVKEEIKQVRDGADGTRLYDLSQEYFTLVNEAVSLAEQFCETQVTFAIRIISGLSLVFVVIVVVAVGYYIRMAQLRKRAEVLNRIAYLDSMTGIPNRSRCEQIVQERMHNPPTTGRTAVLMFDMNNLKRVNDQLGHRAGDQIIIGFATILQEEMLDNGFIGRYGGDEFLAVIDDTTEEDAGSYINRVQDRILQYNAQRVHDLEKISFAVGGIVDSLQQLTIESMISEADRRMYLQKRQMHSSRT